MSYANITKNVNLGYRVTATKNGDEILKELLYQARQKEIPIILCEMGYDQRDSMSETLSGLGYDTEFYLDLSGLDRGFVAYIR